MSKKNKFNYSIVGFATASQLQNLAVELKVKRQIKSHPIDIGNLLILAKQLIPYGYWMKWVKQELNWHHSTVCKLMMVAKVLTPFVKKASFTSDDFIKTFDLFEEFFGGNINE